MRVRSQGMQLLRALMVRSQLIQLLNTERVRSQGIQLLYTRLHVLCIGALAMMRPGVQKLPSSHPAYSNLDLWLSFAQWKWRLEGTAL